MIEEERSLAVKLGLDAVKIDEDTIPDKDDIDRVQDSLQRLVRVKEDREDLSANKFRLSLEFDNSPFFHSNLYVSFSQQQLFTSTVWPTGPGRYLPITKPNIFCLNLSETLDIISD